MKTLLVLEDGSSFEGVSAGASGERVGQVIIQTAVVGYQEIMTDPANAGRIVVLTYPLIGNYGTAAKFNESGKVWASAIVVREKSKIVSNFQAEESLERFARDGKAVIASEVDTRTLAVRIREKGEMLGILSTKSANKSDLMKKLKQEKKKFRKDFIRELSVKRITNIKGRPRAPKTGVLDLGVTNGFIKQLKTLGCPITLLPYNTPAERILAMRLDGLIISSGPEGDVAVPEVVKTVKALLGKTPMLGVSLGHEIIGLALGGKLKKMKIGHHGVNYPVRPPKSFKGEITVQNHSYIIDESSIRKRKEVKVTLRNVNDNSIEEMESRRLKFISTQYFPAGPGMGEVNDALYRFIQMTKKRKGK